ncbi:MAG: ParB/RepB/Spo0J family partition protein [Mycolicibacterium neoaurum]|nr:ParB/RepB/Spo0J family partition protein [Mycolicibacterium neoaurum]
MTITRTTDPTTTAPTNDDTDDKHGELCWLTLDQLAAHPDNPRSATTDDQLPELVRSIRAHGILEPLVVLPANDDGIHLIIAGHRRHTACRKAGGVDRVPVIIRAMTPIEVIEAMLSENENRAALLPSDQIRAIERLMSLDTGLTPAKLCRRIGKSQAWVRARMAVTVLPARWRTAIDRGELTLAAAEAAAAVADLGPDHLDAVCARLTGRSWSDPARTVAAYRDDLRRDDHYQSLIGRLRVKHPLVYTTADPAPERSKRLGELFDPDTAKAHRDEPCHAVVVRRTSWGDGAETFEVCIDPRRHAPARVAAGKGSELPADNTRPTNHGGDDSHAKRQGRLARLAHATETFAKTRGGISQTDLTRLALRGLISEAGREALGYAATILGYAQPRDVTTGELLDAADSPAALARVAGAVAAGVAETAMYWSSGSQPCRDYLAILTGTGWTPDHWTAAVLARHTDTTAEDTHDSVADADADADDDGDDDSDEDGLDG